ncbi:MAG: hypothetical protein ACYTG1_13020 [Planctomycetota bacterium]|jgi:hypothetical protein
MMVRPAASMTRRAAALVVGILLIANGALAASQAWTTARSVSSALDVLEANPALAGVGGAGPSWPLVAVCLVLLAGVAATTLYGVGVTVTSVRRTPPAPSGAR